MPTSHPTAQSGIYQIRNLVNGKIYIGSAVKFESRWAVHRHFLRKNLHHSKYLQRSWNKYGRHKFVFEILEFVSCKQDLVRVEQEWFDRIRPFDPVVGFNVSPTAGSTLGKGHTDDTKTRISEAKKGVKLPPVTDEHRANLSKALKGRKKSPEEIANHSASLRGRKLSQEHIDKVSASLKGRKQSPEEIADKSARLKGKRPSDATLAAAAEYRKTHGHTQETCEKIRRAHLGRIFSPEHKLAISKGQVGRKLTAEAIENRTRSRKANRDAARSEGQLMFDFDEQKETS